MERPLTTLTELVDPANAALLVIDMQKDYCARRLSTRDTSLVDDMMPRLLRLMDAAREKGVRIIHVHTLHPDWTNSPAWVGRKWKGDRPSPELCRPGTEGAEYMPGFDPKPDELEITKYRYSGFIGTNLELTLRSLGVKSIIATGAATNNCVEATARDGYMLDFYLVFMSDATASYDQLLHDTTLTNMRNHYATVANVDEVIACWQPAAVGRAQEAVVPVGATR